MNGLYETPYFLKIYVCLNQNLLFLHLIMSKGAKPAFKLCQKTSRLNGLIGEIKGM